jgi:hypothetical protein
MRAARVVRVSGRVSGAREGSNVVVMMTPRGPNAAAPPISNSLVNRENGTFSFSGVMPGAYFVTAREIGPGATWSVRTQLDVSSADVENVSLAFASPITVTGKLRMEGSGSIPGQLPVILTPRDPDQLGVEIPQIVRGSGGAFQILNASPEVYVVETNSRTVYVKGTRVGSVETASPILDLSNGVPSEVEILLGSNPPQVTGAVQYSKTGDPAAGALVVLIPNEPERRNGPFFYRRALTDASGHFLFLAPPQGAYTSYAWADPATAAYMEPDFMKEFEGKGVNVDASEGQKPDIQLTLLRADLDRQ